MLKLSAELIKTLLDYDADTGVLTWKSGIAGVPSGARAGHETRRGYIEVKIFGRRYKAHRLAWLHYFGEQPSSDIDHRNGTKSDNRIANLRLCTDQENSHNQHRPQGANPYLGVSLHRPSGLWQAAIKLNRKQRHLGYFKTPEAARDAYVAAKRQLHPTSTL